MNWPNDADGDVFRRLEENGFNFDKEIIIDFNIDFNHWPLTNEEKVLIQNLYPNCEFIDPDEEDIEEGNQIGYALIQYIGKLSYEFVVKTQKEVTDQVNKIGGWCESWGVMQE